MRWRRRELREFHCGRVWKDPDNSKSQDSFPLCLVIITTTTLVSHSNPRRAVPYLRTPVPLFLLFVDINYLPSFFLYILLPSEQSARIPHDQTLRNHAPNKYHPQYPRHDSSCIASIEDAASAVFGGGKVFLGSCLQAWAHRKLAHFSGCGSRSTLYRRRRCL